MGAFRLFPIFKQSLNIIAMVFGLLERSFAKIQFEGSFE